MKDDRTAWDQQKIVIIPIQVLTVLVLISIIGFFTYLLTAVN